MPGTMLWARDISDTARQTTAQCMREVIRERLREQGVKAPDFRIAPLGSSVDTEKSGVVGFGWSGREQPRSRDNMYTCAATERRHGRFSTHRSLHR